MYENLSNVFDKVRCGLKMNKCRIGYVPSQHLWSWRDGQFTPASTLFPWQACLQLPFDIKINIFYKIVKPVLLYGSEIWGFGNLDILERVQSKFYEYIFNLTTSTPSAMIYWELGILPLRNVIQCGIISFWAKINEDVEETHW